MALKAEHKTFIRWYVKTGDHIVSYIKSVPTGDRKKAATSGKRWLKNAEIAAEIAKAKGETVESVEETSGDSTIQEQKLPPLKPKQKVFCEEYIIDLNGTQAAARAGYSKKTSNEIAAELLAKPSIKAYIQLLLDARSQKTEITAARVLKELAAIAFANIDDFVKVTEEEVIETVQGEDGGMTPNKRRYRTVEVFPTDTVDKEKIPAISSIKQGKSGIELKIHDKEKALELLGRHLGMWNDKLQLGADDELKALYKSVMNGDGK